METVVLLSQLRQKPDDYIAQVKRKCGIELAENFNLPKSEDARQPRCPKEKEEAIVEALKAFQMI